MRERERERMNVAKAIHLLNIFQTGLWWILSHSPDNYARIYHWWIAKQEDSFIKKISKKNIIFTIKIAVRLTCWELLCLHIRRAVPFLIVPYLFAFIHLPYPSPFRSLLPYVIAFRRFMEEVIADSNNNSLSAGWYFTFSISCKLLLTTRRFGKRKSNTPKMQRTELCFGGKPNVIPDYISVRVVGIWFALMHTPTLTPTSAPTSILNEPMPINLIKIIKTFLTPRNNQCKE